jgi:ribosome maturation protein SDO1
MVSIDEAVLARYSHGGRHFEIYVDPDKALALKQGQETTLGELLAAEEVYRDAKKGDRITEAALEEVFGTTNLYEVAKQIILKGELQLTTDQRRKLTEERRKAVIAVIAREAYNPQTKAPHTPQRIETAMDEAGVSISPFEPAESQVESVIKAIRPILPISMERLKLEVLVPPAHTGRIYGILKKYNVQKEEWLQDGHLRAVVEIPAGIEEDLYDEVNSIAKGEVTFKRL